MLALLIRPSPHRLIYLVEMLDKELFDDFHRLSLDRLAVRMADEMNPGDLPILPYDRIEFELLIICFFRSHGAAVAGLNPQDCAEGDGSRALEPKSFEDQFVPVDVEKEAGAELAHDDPENQRPRGGKQWEQPSGQLESCIDIQSSRRIPCRWDQGIEEESEVEGAVGGYQSNAVLPFHEGMGREIEEHSRACGFERYWVHGILLLRDANT